MADEWKLIMDMNERIARLEEKVEALERKVEELRESIERRNSYVKYMIYIYVTTLGFVASLLGLGWRPP